MLNSNVVYWIWLQQALKYGSAKVKEILESYGDAEKFYIAGEREWRLSGLFTNKEIDSLNSVNMENVQKILADCNKTGCSIITLSNHRYPYLLKQIDNPPAVLYVLGDLTCLDGKIAIAVVGTRKASYYGINMAKEICTGLVNKGVVVVSGGAIGIDCVAHETVVMNNGKTICVLGCGLNFPYLTGKNGLKREIVINGGAVISEYPPNMPAYPYNFPIRNRIISGLSHGTVIVEAGEKSGSLITANCANNQNRDVYVIPPIEENQMNSGSYGLIRDGAQILTGVDDILREYPHERIDYKPSGFRSFRTSKKAYEFKTVSTRDRINTQNQVVSKEDLPIPQTNNLSDEERMIYNTVCGGKIHVDIIVEKVKMPSYKIFSVLTKLEVRGLIRSLPGKYYEVI